MDKIRRHGSAVVTWIEDSYLVSAAPTPEEAEDAIEWYFDSMDEFDI